MTRWRSLWTPVRTLLRRRRAEDEMDEELRDHLQREIDERVRRGASPAEAQAAARLAFGRLEHVKDDCRQSWGVRLADTVAQDLRIGVRMLRRSPGFTLAILVAMALGIGANTAIFSVVYGAVLRPLPYDTDQRLVVLHTPIAGDQAGDTGFSAPEIRDVRQQATTLDRLVEHHWMTFIFFGHTEPERLRTGVVSADYFDALGIAPLHGRLFLPGDDTPEAPGVLVLSHAYWQRAFGGDPRVVGRTFRFNDRPHTVIGVLPPVPLYPEENTVYMPVSHCPFHTNPRMLQMRTARMKQAFARLKPGVTLEQAQAELDAIRGRLQTAYPEAYREIPGSRIVATPLLTELTHDFHATVIMLVATATLVLLIVCASVANLLLARLLRRERELAVRTAIGAGRLRLTCQLLTESLVLTTGGALLGLAVAAGSLTLLRTLAARFTPRAQEVSIDGTVLLFTLGLAVLTGLIFGALPALQNSRSVLPSLSETGGGATGNPGRVRLRNSLVVAQVAVSMALLARVGLMARSFVNLTRVDPGFRAEQVATGTVDLNSRNTEPRRAGSISFADSCRSSQPIRTSSPSAVRERCRSTASTTARPACASGISRRRRDSRCRARGSRRARTTSGPWAFHWSPDASSRRPTRSGERRPWPRITRDARTPLVSCCRSPRSMSRRERSSGGFARSAARLDYARTGCCCSTKMVSCRLPTRHAKG